MSNFSKALESWISYFSCFTAAVLRSRMLNCSPPLWRVPENIPARLEQRAACMVGANLWRFWYWSAGLRKKIWSATAGFRLHGPADLLSVKGVVLEHRFHYRQEIRYSAMFEFTTEMPLRLFNFRDGPVKLSSTFTAWNKWIMKSDMRGHCENGKIKGIFHRPGINFRSKEKFWAKAWKEK